MAQRPPWFRLETLTGYYLTWTFSEGPSSRDDVAPGGLTHTDESSTCLSGIVRGSGIASHRPLSKKQGNFNIVLRSPTCSSSKESSKFRRK